MMNQLPTALEDANMLNSSSFEKNNKPIRKNSLTFLETGFYLAS